MRARILFLNLPYDFAISRASRWPEKTKSGTLYYPYWLCYAAGVCMEQGHEVNLVDCVTKKLSVDATIELIKREVPQYLMVEITTPTLIHDYQVLTRIKSQCPSIRLIVGGTHATVLSRQVLEECLAIDVIARQEYDFTIGDIVKNWENPGAVEGITYRDEQGCVQQTGDRPWLQDMDSLPFVSQVYERFLDSNDYCYAFAQKPMVQVFSARGCPFHCNFCSYPQSMSGHRFRKRSVKNFVDELEYIHKHLPAVREIFIEDDTFTVDKKRVVAICDEILERDLSITWSCNTRADLPYEVMQKMKAAGCRLLVVGYESGNQQVLDATRKGIQLEDSLAFSHATKRLGLKVFGCFMIGLTGDNLQTIEDTFRFAQKTRADEVFFQQAVPFPGTTFYQWAKDEGYLRTEDYAQWLNEGGYLNCLLDYPYARAAEIEKLRDRLMSRYYFSFTYIVRTFLANLSWAEFTRVAKAGSAYIRFRLKKVFR
ncbi:MAG: B12-binding domain-containing radical SAM protein [Coriobacteriales bacterium]|nr:B12-binding domain-containing radical SAM protein [Coriobacteriales bacterium]